MMAVMDFLSANVIGSFFPTAFAVAVFYATAPRFYKKMDQMEAHIRNTWPDSVLKRIILLRVNPCPSAHERGERG